MKRSGLSREEKNAIVYKKTPARIAAEEAAIKLNAVTEETVVDVEAEVAPAEVVKKPRAKKVVTEEAPAEAVEAVVDEEIINPEN